LKSKNRPAAFAPRLFIALNYVKNKIMPKKSELGQMLVDEGVLSKQQLQEAVYNQVIFGGRLGTNLLELGFLDEESLARYLARQHRVKTVKLSDLAGISPVVIKIIPKKLAERYQVVPIRLDGNKLYVVMSDPSQMGAISELSFVTGKVIVPLVLPEVRIFELLNQYYGLGRELRYINIAMMEAERRKKQAARAVAKITPVKKKVGAAAEDQAREEFKEKIISGKPGELISEKEFEAMTTSFYLKKEIPPGQKPAAIPESQTPPKQETAAAEPTPSAAAPAPREQPYGRVARAIYEELLNQGIGGEIPTDRIRSFLKAYVLSELKDFVLPLKMLSAFLLSESNTPGEKVSQIIDNIAGLGSELHIRMLKPDEEPEAQKPAAAEEVVELEEEVVELKPVSEEPEVSYLPEPEQISEEPVEEPEPEIPKLGFAEATKQLMEKTKNRDDLAKAVLGFAQGFFKRAVLFTVRGEQIFGWYGIGPKIKIRQIQQLLIPLTEPSVFKTTVDASCHYLGPMIPQPENDKFLQAVGGEKPNSVFLIPIIWQTKVVYVLYGDNGQGENAPFDIGELLILAQKLPAAIERLIEEKKKQYQVIQGGKQ